MPDTKKRFEIVELIINEGSTVDNPANEENFIFTKSEGMTDKLDPKAPEAKEEETQDFSKALADLDTKVSDMQKNFDNLAEVLGGIQKGIETTQEGQQAVSKKLEEAPAMCVVTKDGHVVIDGATIESVSSVTEEAVTKAINALTSAKDNSPEGKLERLKDNITKEFNEKFDEVKKQNDDLKELIEKLRNTSVDTKAGEVDTKETAPVVDEKEELNKNVWGDNLPFPNVDKFTAPE